MGSTPTPGTSFLFVFKRLGCVTLKSLLCSSFAAPLLFVANFMPKGIRKMFAFANNHYAGHAPATVKLFSDL